MRERVCVYERENAREKMGERMGEFCRGALAPQRMGEWCSGNVDKAWV